MSEAWFSIQFAPWLSLLSLFSLLSYLQFWAHKGRHRHWVMGCHWASTAFGFALLLFGGFAYGAGQPYWVWFSLVLCGALLGSLMLWATLKIGKDYDAAELRKSIASDL